MESLSLYHVGGREAKVEGAYRLIRNHNIAPEIIQASGFQHTAELTQPYSELLAVDDTTSLVWFA